MVRHIDVAKVRVSSALYDSSLCPVLSHARVRDGYLGSVDPRLGY